MSTIAFVGLPGAGKTTQAQMLTDNPRSILTVGDEIRKLAREDSDLGRKVKAINDSGNLADPALVNQIVENWVRSFSNTTMLILDGYPRSIVQSEFVQNLLPTLNRKIDALVLLDITYEESERRLNIRANQKIRADDNPEVIKQRFAVFEKSTQDFLNWANEHDWPLVKVNGMGTRQTVNKRLTQALSLQGVQVESLAVKAL